MFIDEEGKQKDRECDFMIALSLSWDALFVKV